MSNLAGQFVNSFTRQMGRNVANTVYNQNLYSSINENLSIGKIIDKTFRFDRISKITLKGYIGWVLGLSFPPFISTICIIYLFIKGYRKYHCFVYDFVYYIRQNNYVSDRRYNSGARFVGSTYKKKYTTLTPKEFDSIVFFSKGESNDFTEEYGGMSYKEIKEKIKKQTKMQGFKQLILASVFASVYLFYILLIIIFVLFKN